MVLIESIIAAPIDGGYYFDDQQAIGEGAERDGFCYKGKPVKAGFSRIRQPAKALSVLILLSDGSIVEGDATSVQYSGVEGRDPLFRPSAHLSTVEDRISPILVGCDANEWIDNIDRIEVQFKGNLHTSLKYGISQALLNAASSVSNRTPTELIADEYNLEPADTPIPIFAQSGDNRQINADKMILKEVDIIPHGLFNSLQKVGPNGSKLLEYVNWLRKRVDTIGRSEYHPTFHLDVYGTLGEIWGSPQDNPDMVEYLSELENASGEYDLQIEDPLTCESKNAKIIEMAELNDILEELEIDIKLVADQWCNTRQDIRDFVNESSCDIIQIKTPDLGYINKSIESIIECKCSDIGAYLGGSCAETNVSARLTANVAVATTPSQVLAKPGMGVDEGVEIVRNEMIRTIYKCQMRKS